MPACLLVPDMIRTPMARLLKRAAPRLKVLNTGEPPARKAGIRTQLWVSLTNFSNSRRYATSSSSRV